MIYSYNKTNQMH